MASTFILLLTLLALTILRCYLILPKKRSHSTGRRDGSIGVFLGSGGHTTEALQLISTLEPSRFQRRLYLVSEGDTLSAVKVHALEQQISASLEQGSQAHSYTIVTLPRLRRVHQSLLSTPLSALRSLLTALSVITLPRILPAFSKSTPFPAILLLNGPGTCMALCIAVYCNKFLGLPAPRLLYVESFARVRSLSLTGKLLRPFVDRFVVQWPDILNDGGRGECRGWLV